MIIILCRFLKSVTDFKKSIDFSVKIRYHNIKGDDNFMNLLQIVLFLIMFITLTVLFILDTNAHKEEEEKLKKEIRKLKLELRRLKNDFENTPEREIQDLQNELSAFSEKFERKMQNADKFAEQKRQESNAELKDFQQYIQNLKQEANQKMKKLHIDIETLSRRIDLYQDAKQDFKTIIMQSEEIKTEINSMLYNSRRDIMDCYYDVQEKIAKLSEIPEEVRKTETQSVPVRKKIYTQEPEELLRRIDKLSKTFSNKEAGRRFEKIICILLKANGFSHIRLTKDSNDDGIDIFAEKNMLSYAIQCKCYLKDVDKKAIQEIASGNFKYHQDKAAAVTNRHFNSYARQFAEELNVELWEREKILNMMRSLSPDDFAHCFHICENPETGSAKAVRISVSKPRNKK